jgi:hypothetical protein
LDGTLNWRLRRGIGFAAVLVVHAILVIGFLNVPLTQTTRPPIEEFFSTWILIPAPSRSPPQRAPRLQAPSPKLQPIPSIETSTIDPVAPAATLGAKVDWNAEGRQAAATATTDPKFPVFGQHPHSDRQPPERQPKTPHYAGEYYMDEFGSRIFWVSDSCYVISDPPLPGMPPGLNMSRTGCIDYSRPVGQLFKDFPAYKKYHPD